MAYKKLPPEAKVVRYVVHSPQERKKAPKVSPQWRPGGLDESSERKKAPPSAHCTLYSESSAGLSSLVF